MPEYIDKSVVLDQISKQKLFYEEQRKQSGDCLEEMNCVGAENGLTGLEDVISDIPSADIAPVVHAKWENCDWVEPYYHGCGTIRIPNAGMKCTNCVHVFKKDLLWKDNYCPNCGAKMDFKEDQI